ncbi:MAG: glycosyltransferase family 4 protein [Opitutaceae bacterium]|nr:glycosyltransferase family 4 protein [Opitutaceae bacterium]
MPSVAYLCTTFPKDTEQFIRREAHSLSALGVDLRVYSLWGGGACVDLRVETFPKWKLLTLVWHIPFFVVTRPRLFGRLVRGLCTRRAPSWLNFWENMLGAGFAAIHAAQFRRDRPDLVHAAWGGAPATAAWLLRQLDGYPYSLACHAYDIYQDGGDWWLTEKAADAAFVHTSTAMGRSSLIVRGVTPEKIHAILSGLPARSAMKPLRTPRTDLRLLCVARLVPKKGLDHQLRIYAALKAAGVAFEARITGDGPLRAELETLARELGVDDHVKFLGHRPPSEIAGHLAWADVMLHTGVIAADGDRDGLPNVIPEAMAAGVLVVTSPAAATLEAITHDVTGLVADPAHPDRWVDALTALRDDEARGLRLQKSARVWVDEHFDADKNTARLTGLFENAACENKKSTD